MTASPTVPTFLPTVWSKRIRLLRRATATVSLLAVAVDLVTMIGNRTGAGAYLALAVSTAAILLTPRFPLWGLLLAVAGCGAVVAFGWDPTALWTIAVFTLLSATLAGVPPFRSGLIVATMLWVLVGLVDGRGLGSAAALAAVSAAAAAAGIGGGLRAQVRYRGVLEQRSSEAASQAVVAERLRIARDLHDLVGHQVAALNMHIGVAEVSLPPGADQAATALGHARTAVQSVLSETQQILVVLRRGDTTSSSAESGRPSPGHEQLTDLLDSFRQLGLRVDADLSQLDQDLGPSVVGLTLYRVVQESLTNAARHGDGTALLKIIRTDETVTVTVANPRGSRIHPITGRSGYGLVGMRERVDAAGGTLQVSNGDDTFQLTVTLPVSSDRSP